MRNYPNWKTTDSTDLMKSLEGKDNGSLWVDVLHRSWEYCLRRSAAFFLAAQHNETKTMLQIIKYYSQIVTFLVAGALRNNHNLCSLRVCQLQLTWNCDRRPVWVFRHGLLTTLFSPYWSVTWVFSLLKASICPSRKGDVSSVVLRAMITGTCVSLVNACIAGERFWMKLVISFFSIYKLSVINYVVTERVII